MQMRDRSSGRHPRALNVLVVVLGFCMSVWLPAIGWAQTFDHDQTAFPLTGAHSSVACESCHITAAVQATPSQCSACHNGGIAPGKPAGHVRTTANCDNCHTTASFAAIRFDHSSVSGTCSSCHNGVQATGKSAGHIVTSAECDSCHKSTMTWAGASIDHSGFT